MNEVDKLDMRFQCVVCEANRHMILELDKKLERIAIAIYDLRTNDCGCGEAMRIHVVEDLIREVELELGM